MSASEDARQRREERAARILAARELSEAGFVEHLHPRDRSGRFRRGYGSLKPHPFAPRSTGAFAKEDAARLRALNAAGGLTEPQARKWASDVAFSRGQGNPWRPSLVKLSPSGLSAYGDALEAELEEMGPTMVGEDDGEYAALQDELQRVRGEQNVLRGNQALGAAFRSSRWQMTHAGGGGITDTQGEYVHGWAGRTGSGFYATLTKADGSSASGSGSSPHKALDAAHAEHRAGRAKATRRGRLTEALVRSIREDAR